MKSLIRCLLGFYVFFALNAHAENMCSDTLSSSLSGSLYDSGGPGADYGKNENCSFLIKPTVASVVTLTFSEFDLKNNKAFLELYDGDSISAPQIANLTGNTGGSYTANSGIMFVRFISNEQKQDKSGFAATWQAVPVPTSTCSGTGTLNAVGIKIDGVGRNTQIDTTTEALAIHAAWLAAGSPASGLIDSGTYNVAASGSSTVDRIDFGGSAHDFSGSLPYPGVAAGVTGSDFLVHASGLLSLPAGDYTIFVESDDGFSFIMNALSGDTVSFNKFGSSTSGGGNELRYENPTANSNTGGSFTLSQDSVFDIAAIFYERGGGDYLEISIANDIRTSFSPNGYEILRDGALNDKVKFRQCGVPLPAPVLEYRFDSCNWADARDVIDSGPNGLDAYAVNGVVSTVGGQICGLAQFDSADDYVRLSDTDEVDLPDTLTAMAWIYLKNTPSELKTIISKDTNYEFHINSNREVFWWWQDADNNTRSFSSGAQLSLNHWHHVAIVYQSGLQVIYIDGQEAARQIFEGQLIVNSNDLQIGQDQGIGSRFFDGNIDEVKIFDVALSSIEVEEVFNNEEASKNYDGALRSCNCVEPVLVDHYAVSHDLSMVSCLTEDITFTAHDNADLAIDAKDALLQISTSTSKGEWLSVVSGSGVLNNLGNGQASYQFPDNGDTSVTLRFSYPDLVSDPELLNFNVTDGVSTDKRNASDLEDKDLSVSDSGLVFSIPDTESCQSSVLVGIKAVKKSDNSLSCSSAVAGNQTVNFYSQYLTPSSGSQALILNASGTDYSLSTAAPGTPVSMLFNSQGEASMTVSYPDAGRVSINAELTVGQKVLSGSDSFVVYPAQLSVIAETSAGVALDNNSVAGGVVWAAARPFTLKVSGQCSTGTVTPNYQPSNVELGANLHTPTEAAGGVSGDLTVFAGNLAVNDAVGWLNISTGFSNGVFEDLSARYSEVGIINLYAKDQNYYGHVISQTVAPVGRFIPWSFGVAANSPIWEAHCSSGNFSYMDETIEYQTSPELVVTSFNAVGGRVYNYGGSLWKLSAQLDDRFYVDKSVAVSAILNSTVDIALDTWNGTETDYDGAAINSLGTDSITYTRNVLEAPFNGLTDLTLTIADLTDTDGACYRIDSDADGDWLEESCSAFTISNIPAKELRFGRLRLADAYGPETGPLPFPWVAEYYNGLDFIINTTDNCSAWLTSEVTYSDNDGALLASGQTAAAYAHSGADFRVDAGDAGVTMSAPGAGNTGVVGVAVDLTRMPYFFFDWDGDGSFDDAPLANIIFGQYRSNDRVIFQRQW